MTARDGDQLTEIVLGVEGVVDAFPPPSIPQLIAAAAGELEASRPLAPTHEGMRVDARISTRRTGRSADIARAVADALAGRYADPDARISVQIARIH
ncbi:hypothetical protein ACFXQA_14705 [Microbacterium sp. P07]|uniref:hypothetical protein n=1 Tax=Microbacterium sp. P07 TaxID=3366952 RepID=UPI0037477696